MTELIWDGKYDANGKKVAPPRIFLASRTAAGEPSGNFPGYEH